MRVPHHVVKEEEPIGESSSQTGKLAISVDDSIVLVNIEDILFVGLIEGEVTIQTITEPYHTADTLAMLEKAPFSVVCSCAPGLYRQRTSYFRSTAMV